MDRPVEILQVEDNEDDVFITRKGFENGTLKVNLSHVEDGKDCLDFLFKRGQFKDAPTPDLILLDLNLPVMSGREVLAEMVKHKSLQRLPVIVLTTSDSESDLEQMYELGCNSYIKKPIGFEEFQQVIKVINDYWFHVVKLPSQVKRASPPA